MPAITKAQTTKQAKASYKARGRPTLTEKEQRQLERAIELEYRAERAREAEKRRADAAKKRAEQEKRSGKSRTTLGSQRTVDRHGFLASQFHLGAFFRVPKGQDAAPAPAPAPAKNFQEDEFEDDGLNDEELLNAFEVGSTERINTEPAEESAMDAHCDAALMPPPPLVPAGVPRTLSCTPISQSRDILGDDINNLWDELSSSTQIARELNHSTSEGTKGSNTRNWSFSSGEFDDITTEDLDELDASMHAPARASQAPDWASTVAEDVSRSGQSKATPHSQAVHDMPSPRPAQAAHRTSSPGQSHRSDSTTQEGTVIRNTKRPASLHSRCSGRSATSLKPSNAIKGPFMPASTLYCSPDLGFTLTQLETFVGDEIQLSQAVT